MSLEVQLRLSPDPSRFVDSIQDLKVQLRDFREPFRSLLPVVASEVASTIKAGGSPIGARWPHLSEATRQRYGATSHAMLQRTGKLLRAMSSPSRGKRSLTKSRLRFGPKETYQFVQHYGSKKRGIPARPYIGVTPGFRAAALAALDQHVARLLARASQNIGGKA